ncbi:uncharacterized protein BXZ73DRAFT_105082 [Epithele typhae]|uniref:uncharacterized protein n=1 Tax=Epithele typhae TaxID=378194 RepID=UPI0020089940|nr:uncharacterized protein BXZ73DRAFT_105082 [Epithele typhae]KAH9918927.1 hypothetical protein BXZ73DRAFT_105082 [Epithele typhae]
MPSPPALLFSLTSLTPGRTGDPRPLQSGRHFHVARVPLLPVVLHNMAFTPQQITSGPADNANPAILETRAAGACCPCATTSATRMRTSSGS